MAAPFTPLLDPGKYDNPSFMNTPSEIAAAKPVIQQKQPMNPVIPPELATMEDRLKQSGSSTSTLTSIAAWLGAAKGDFRGIQAIEEQKRRTALAKSMSPEVIKVNNMVNSGKWEEAQSYVNEMVNTYGQRAPELIPYLDAMAARIAKKQEGWENLRGVANLYKETVKEDNVNYPVLKALEKAVERRDNLSETSLQGFLTRAGVHVQNIDGRLTLTQPITGETRTEMLPAIVKGSDIDNFAGNTVAAKHGLNTKQLADIMNGLAVKSDTGDTIAPNSKTAQTIKTQFNALQPINAALEVAKLAPIEPAMVLQLLKDNGLLAVATRSFGGGANAIEKAINEQMGRTIQQQIAVVEGTEQARTIMPSEGIVINLDESNPDTFLTRRTETTTRRDVTNSGGKLGLISPDMMGIITQNQFAVQGLDTATQMLKEGTRLETTGDKLAQGLLQKLSYYIGYPLTEGIQTRQAVKTILKTAIEQIENTAFVSPGQIRGGDSDDLKQLKQFAAGDFKSEKEVIDAITKARTRLVNATKMLAGQNVATGELTTQQQQQQQQKKEKTPVEVLTPAVTKAQRGKPQQSQITRDPYGPGGIQIPVDIEEGIRKAVEATGKAAKGTGKPVGGSQRVVLPNGPTGTASPGGQAVGQPQQKQQGYSEEDEIAKSSRQKQLQRAR